MDGMEHLFLKIDFAILDGLRHFGNRDLEPVAIRLSPAALDVMRADPSARFDMVDTAKHGYVWRGLPIIIEAALPIGGPSEYENIKVCVEAKQHGDHGRHFYFDANTSGFPQVLKMEALLDRISEA